MNTELYTVQIKKKITVLIKKRLLLKKSICNYGQYNYFPNFLWNCHPKRANNNTACL